MKKNILIKILLLFLIFLSLIGIILLFYGLFDPVFYATDIPGEGVYTNLAAQLSLSHGNLFTFKDNLPNISFPTQSGLALSGTILLIVASPFLFSVSLYLIYKRILKMQK